MHSSPKRLRRSNAFCWDDDECHEDMRLLSPEHSHHFKPVRSRNSAPISVAHAVAEQRPSQSPVRSPNSAPIIVVSEAASMSDAARSVPKPIEHEPPKLLRDMPSEPSEHEKLLNTPGRIHCGLERIALAKRFMPIPRRDQYGRDQKRACMVRSFCNDINFQYFDSDWGMNKLMTNIALLLQYWAVCYIGLTTDVAWRWHDCHHHNDGSMKAHRKSSYGNYRKECP